MIYEHEREPESEVTILETRDIAWPPLVWEEWPRFDEYLAGRGLSSDLARWNGWYPAMVHGEVGIVIPATGTTQFWQFRTVRRGATKRYDGPYIPRGDTVVLVSPPTSSHPYSVLVEGPMDALAAAEWGHLSVALMGNTPPQVALNLTKDLVRDTLVLVLEDRDGVGNLAGVVGYLSSQGIRCIMASTPSPWKDLADMPRYKRERFLTQILLHGGH